MAKLIEQTFVITISKMVPNSTDIDALPLSPDNLSEIVSVVEALAGENTLVEFTVA